MMMMTITPMTRRNDDANDDNKDDDNKDVTTRIVTSKNRATNTMQQEWQSMSSRIVLHFFGNVS